MYRTHGRQRSKGGFDDTITKGDIENNNNEMKKLEELGKEYLQDKEEIETMLELVESSDLDSKQRAEYRRQLEAKKEYLVEKYDKEVLEKHEELVEKNQENIEDVEGNVTELQEKEDNIRSVESKSGSMDLSSVADGVAADKDAQQEYVNQQIQELNLRIEQQQMIMREMRTNNLRGKL